MPIDQQRYAWIMEQIAAEREAARRKAGIPMPESEMPYVGEAGSGGPLRGGVPPAPVEPVEQEQAVWGGPVQAGTGALLNPSTANFDVPQGDVNLYEPQSAPPPVGMGGGGKSAGGGASSGFELPEDRPAQAPARRKPGQPVGSVSVPTPEQDAKVVAESDADKWLADLDSMYGQIRGTEFDVNRWMKKLSVGAKIATGLSLAALAVSDAMAERRGEQPRNSVQKTIKQLIDMDVSEQRENYERKLGDFKAATNLYGIFRQKGLDEKAAENAAKAYKLQEAGMGQDADKLKEQIRHNKAVERHNDLMARLSTMQGAGGKPDARSAEMAKATTQRAVKDLQAPLLKLDFAGTQIDAVENAYRKYLADRKSGGFFSMDASKEYVQKTKGMLAGIVKAMGESGALTDTDLLRAEGLIPVVYSILVDQMNLSKLPQQNSVDEGNTKLGEMRSLLRKGVLNILRKTNNPEARQHYMKMYNVSEQELGATPNSMTFTED